MKTTENTLITVMRHVASNTTDPWAKAYLMKRLQDLGLDSQPQCEECLRNNAPCPAESDTC